MRQRQVFPTAEIPHLWAHQTQAEARNPQGNLYFKGPTLYSYRDSYPIAAIHARKAGKLVLICSENYSVTTAGHIESAARAVSHMTAIHVPYVTLADPRLPWSRDGLTRETSDVHERNVKYLTDLAAEHLAKAERAMQVHTVNWRRQAAFRALTDVGRYMGFFGIRRKAPQIPAAAWAAAEERARRIETPDPVRDAKAFKAKARRQEKTRAALQAQFDVYSAQIAAYNAEVLKARENMPDAAEHWRATGSWPSVDISVNWPYIPYRTERKMRAAGFSLPAIARADGRPEEVLLRVNGDEIETSKGARIPLEHAGRLWTLVQACRSTGRAYERNGHTEHAGKYAIDRIDADGTLHVGCHRIAYAEIERMAVTLGLKGVS